MNKIVVLIPAAGASSRMRGADKLLETVAGQPLLARQVMVARAAGLRVLVTLRADRPARSAAIAELGADTQIIEDPSEGIAASVRAGARWAQAQGASLLVLLADLPEITAEDLALLVRSAQEAPGRIVQATAADGTPGHPVIWPVTLLPALSQVRGDSGGRQIMAAPPAPILRVALPGARAITDLDTPEAWAAWRQSTNA